MRPGAWAFLMKYPHGYHQVSQTFQYYFSVPLEIWNKVVYELTDAKIIKFAV